MAVAGKAVHLLVLVHGWQGRPTHMADMKEIAEATIKSTNDLKLNVLVAKTNSMFQTMDGIEWGARRIASEVSFDFVSLC